MLLTFNGDSLLDSVQGGSNRRHEGITPLDQQVQLFTVGINFPADNTESWREKVTGFCSASANIIKYHLSALNYIYSLFFFWVIADQ
jgi:hypothetical protein